MGGAQMISEYRVPKIAIVGVGLAASPHAYALTELRNIVTVAGVVGQSRHRLETFCRTHGFKIADSLEHVLSSEDIDAVLVLTPPNTHFSIVEKAASAGKHILLEKPLDVSTEHAARMLEICAIARVELGIVFQNRFRESVQRLAATVQQGQLGKLAYIGIDMRWWRPQAYYDEPGRGSYNRDGGGVLMTQAIHIIDLMLWLAGDVTDVTANATTSILHRMEAEDYVSAALRFKSGAVGNLFATTAAFPGFPERLELVGDKGTAVLTGGHLQVFFRSGETTDFHDSASTGYGANPMEFSHSAHRALISNFVSAITGTEVLLVTGKDALRAQRLIDQLCNR
jgi:UDP-N-acetyl-2-amino-2-deoxyglucuronate dehydrogenase